MISLRKRRNLDTDTHTQGECHVNIKADTGDVLQAKEYQNLPANYQELEQAWNRIFPVTSRGSRALPTS